MEQQNVVTEADGTKHYFPAGTTPEEMDAALKAQAKPATLQTGINPTGEIGSAGVDFQGKLPSRDQVVDFARPIVSQGVADIAGGATAATGVGLGLAPAAYGASYVGTDALMQYLKSKSPDSVGDALGEGGVQLGENLLLKGLVKGGGRLLKTVLGDTKNVAQTFTPESYNPKLKQTQIIHIPGEHPNEILAVALNPTAQGTKAPDSYVANKLKNLGIDLSHVVGSADITPFDDAGKELYSQGVFVNPDWQRQGIATNLYRSVENATGLKIRQGMMTDEGAAFRAKYKSGKIIEIKKPSDFYDFLPTTGQAAGDAAEKVDPLQVGSLWDKLKLKGLSTGANIIENMSLSAKEQALDRSAGAGFTEGLKLASSSEFSRLGNGQRAFSMNPNKALELVNRNMGPTNPTAALLNQSTEAFPTIASLDKVLGDKLKLDKVLATAQSSGVGDNVRKTMAGYKFQQVFNNAITRNLDGSVGRIDPEVLSKEWTAPEMQDTLKTLYNGPTRDRITEFFQNIEKTQESGGYSKSGLFNIVRGGVRLSAGLLTGSLTGAGALGTAGISGVFVAAPLLGKLLANPAAAKYITAIAGGQPLGVSEKYVAGVLASALQGSVIALEDGNGKQTPVMVKDGKMVPVGR